MSFPDHLITRDRVAVALERQIILRYARNARTVLDVGCGTGETLRWLSAQGKEGQTFVGLEPHPDLYTAAAERALPPGETYLHGDHTTITGQYDYIYTQRMLIQLPTWEAQYAAIQRLRSHLTPEGRLVCVEPHRMGLTALNEKRLRIGLPAIEPPRHTNYLPDVLMYDTDVALTDDAYFGQHYSFLSRVVEAYRAQQEGREPRYMDPDSVEGRLCLALPDNGECFGQYHYSVWGAEAATKTSSSSTAGLVTRGDRT